MKATIIALLCLPTSVDAFASMKPADPTNPEWDYQLLAQWFDSPNACSTPESLWDVGWETYANNKTPLCQLHTTFAYLNDNSNNSRWEMMNHAALYPQRIISKRGSAGYVELQKDLSKAHMIENYVVQNREYSEYDYPANPTLQNILDQDNTDGILIMHQGKVVYEKYKPPYEPWTRHRVFSNTKSFVGLMAMMLIHEERLHEGTLLTDIIPQLMGSGFEGATVGHALSMRVAVEYSEDPVAVKHCVFPELYGNMTDAVLSASYTSDGRLSYTYPVVKHCEFFQMIQATYETVHPYYYKEGHGSWFRMGPQNIREFIPLLKRQKDQSHGVYYSEEESYRSIVTDVVAWVVDKTLEVDGSSAEEYLEEKIWSKVGLEADGIIQMGYAQIPYWHGGLSTTLPDMLRIGEMMREGGRNKDGNEVLPEAVVERLRHPPEDHKPKGSKTPDSCKGYYNKFWIGKNQAGPEYANETSFFMQGIWGQYVWVYPHLEMVVARHSTDVNWNDNAKVCVHDAAFQELHGALLAKS